jgi:hypothetical protein
MYTPVRLRLRRESDCDSELSLVFVKYHRYLDPCQLRLRLGKEYVWGRPVVGVVEEEVQKCWVSFKTKEL